MKLTATFIALSATVTNARSLRGLSDAPAAEPTGFFARLGDYEACLSKESVVGTIDQWCIPAAKPSACIDASWGQISQENIGLTACGSIVDDQHLHWSDTRKLSEGASSSEGADYSSEGASSSEGADYSSEGASSSEGADYSSEGASSSEGADYSSEGAASSEGGGSTFLSKLWGKARCVKKHTFKWGLTKEKMCVNICKGGEVKFDWSNNKFTTPEEQAVGRTDTHNVFAIHKHGYETCKQDDYTFLQAKYLGGWEDPSNEGQWKNFADKPNPGTSDSNDKYHIEKNIQPPADGSSSLYFGCNMGNGQGFGCTGGIKAIVNVEKACE